MKRAVLAFLAGCTSPEWSTTTSDVVGGELTSPGEFPGVGALMYDMGGGPPQFGCTGTLIAPTVVLTAGHCLDPALVGDGVPGFTLALDTFSTPTVVPGAMAIPHEQFDLEMLPAEGGFGETFDIGLVVLAQPITEVAPIPMPRPTDAPELVAGLQMQIAGYGATDAQGNGGGVMFDAATAVISLDTTELQVGMGAPQPQNCYGDSGGPGFATVGGVRRVIGVVSRSFANSPDCNTGGIDTRVDAYLPWIHAHLPAGTAVPCDSGLAEACPEPNPEPDPDDPMGEEDGGCCSTGGTGTGSALLALGLGLLVLRRRR